MRLIFLLVFLFVMAFVKAQTDSIAARYPVQANYFSSFDGTRIYYERQGHGKPVLLVHGFMGSTASWKRTALYRDLLAAGYQVVLLDLRGNGRSDKPHDSTAYEADAEAKDIIGLLQQLKINQYVAVGYSRGAIITARLLVLDGHVRAAVLGGMGSDFTNPEWPRRKMFYRALMGDSVPELSGVIEYVQKQKMDRLALAYQQRAQPTTSKEALGNVQQPVLVICGDKDADNGSAAGLARLFRNATLATTPGDHNAAAATPEFSKEAIRFLQAIGY